VEELASKSGAKAAPLFRLMRATASVGVLAEGADGRFSQTPLSDVLRTNAKPSLRAWATMVSQEWHVRGWGHLEHCVRNDQQAIDAIYGMSAFEYFGKSPQTAAVFNQAMTNISMLDSPVIAATYSFEGIGSVMDVGGGHGLLLASVLAANPGLKGVLYEIPSVIEGAKSGPLTPFMDRCSLSTGDMFTSVPGGVDAYMMKHIIHDWPDDISIGILKRCRQGVNPGGRLLVIDQVIQPGNDFDMGKFLDLEMLIFPGGKERSEIEFREVFTASGWKVNRIIQTQSGISIVEGLPA
jgi:hypothetical protein